ncbi:MAG: LacI family transcriptional regulator [Clostridiales bacterium]|nr:LacI family transcriptional regulator [Clostridiales bacterium]
MNIKEIAKKSEVSITTVSRVLNNPEMVSEETKNRVLTVIEELNYTPNWFARNLQNSKTNLIGMLVPDMLEASNMEMAKGVEKIARSKKNSVILCDTDFDKNTELEYINTLIDRKIDGLILASSQIDEKDAIKLKEREVPFVLIGKSAFCQQENIVYTNYDTAAEEAVDYLIKTGRKRIALILTQYPVLDSQEKLEGYKRALHKNMMKVDLDIIFKTGNNIEGGFEAASKLLESKEVPDAFFIATDTMAFGAIERIKQSGLTPDKLAVIGFDDLPAGAVMEPKLTTVTKPSYRMGLTAARLLFDIIEEPDLNKEAQAIMLQSRLKIRKSCGNKERLKEIW